MIPESFLHDLLNRLDIIDVVERYVPLKKAGVNYVACCPFHNEKTPSFSVSSTKQFYHCFGCGAHGTAIGFLMEHQGLGFVEAVEHLARSIGLALPETAPGTHDHRKLRENAHHTLADVLARATRYYREELKRSENAISYLKKRGVSGEIAARFGIGYAPDGWQNLAAAFPDYQSKSLVEAGLVIESEGKRYDRFRGRILFPILNRQGTIIGFGGRVLETGEPKYLNSPETPLFEKGQELYGLFQARPAIRKAGKVIVVEGYMDVVALAQHGIEYAVATLGTATTSAQVQKLLRQSNQIVFCFDGDAAGRKAAWRALENSLALITDEKGIRFLFLPQNEDPDSYVRKNGKDSFEGLLESALPLSQFMLEKLAGENDMNTLEGRAHFLRQAAPLVQQITAPALRRLMQRRLADITGLSGEELKSLLPVESPTRRFSAPTRKMRQGTEPSLARAILKALLHSPRLAKDFDVALPETDGEMQAIAELLRFFAENPGVTTTAPILEHYRGSPHAGLIGKQIGEIMELGDTFDAQAEFSGALLQLKKSGRSRRVDSLLLRSRVETLSAEEKEELRHLLQGGVAPTDIV